MACTMIVGCGPQATIGEADGGGSGEGGSSDEGPDTAGDTEATHGVVWLELVPAQSQMYDPFEGTEQIFVELLYRDCLLEFYAANPELRADGVEGAAIIEAWRDRLCDPMPAEGDVSCVVDEIRQQLDIDEPSLTLVYRVYGDVGRHRLRVGPFPTSATAGCTAEVSVGIVVGETAGMVDLWLDEVSSSTTAVVDQATAMIVPVAKP